eukprot:Rhum_TRINITY_DN13598_c0_g1::Rhum_TRINITY_DN13598_c0_g1_i1::g.61587::m.61587/K15336/TRDMT1, DNMT2; tRNA (cytosine38-C5)-methyltransferase
MGNDTQDAPSEGCPPSLSTQPPPPKRIRTLPVLEGEWLCLCGAVNTDDICSMRRCRRLRKKTEGRVLAQTPDGVRRVAEFYSGVGGWHSALSTLGEAAGKAQVVCAWDVNENANAVYAHNHPGTHVFSTDLLRATAAVLDHVAADVWVMSPPCQPYTRQGNRQGSEDARAQSFLSILTLLPSMHRAPACLCIENVLGFERSATYAALVAALHANGYVHQTFSLNPLSLGLPNSRPRLYILAKRKRAVPDDAGKEVSPSPFAAPALDGTVVEDSDAAARALLEACGRGSGQKGDKEGAGATVGAFLGWEVEGAGVRAAEDTDESLRIPNEQFGKALEHYDVVTAACRRTGCFTKSYGRRGKGAGSVCLGPGATVAGFVARRTEHREAEAAAAAAEDKAGEASTGIDFAAEFQPRLFSPREVQKLLGYPEGFGFPDSITQAQRYKLLGNGLSVGAAAVVLEYLLLDP